MTLFLSTVGINLLVLTTLLLLVSDVNTFYTCLLVGMFISQGTLAFYVLRLQNRLDQVINHYETKARNLTLINHR